MKYFTRINFVFLLSGILLLTHVSPLPVTLDEYGLGLLGIMYLFCFLEQTHIRSLKAKIGNNELEIAPKDLNEEYQKVLTND